jgi:hypothetical protein
VRNTNLASAFVGRETYTLIEYVLAPYNVFHVHLSEGQNALAIRKEIIDSVVIRTKINFFTTIPAVILLFVAGIDFALLWGVLLFIFSFIPYVGFALATIPPAILGWFEYGPVGALAVVAVFLAINFVAEYVLFPRYAGRGLNLPPYVVLLSVVFWGWLLGALGSAHCSTDYITDPLIIEQLRRGTLAGRPSWRC